MKTKTIKTFFLSTIVLNSCLFTLPCVVHMSSCSKPIQPKPSTLDNITRLDIKGSAVLKITGTGSDYTKAPDLWYSKDGGKNWQQIKFIETAGSVQTIELYDNDVVYLAGNNPAGWDQKFFTVIIAITSADKSNPASVTLGGSIMSLLGDYEGQSNTIPCESCFANLFAGSDALTKISSNFLPATKLAPSCYRGLFSQTTLLTSLPDNLLPAQDLSGADECYSSMFNGSGLTSIPENLLPATKLSPLCYFNMFYDCTSLKSIPANLLPATILAEKCYKNMFDTCKSLESIPDNLLPATNLSDASSCYNQMFYNCTNLKNVPKLPATILSDVCYCAMFEDCSSIESLPTDLFPQNITLANQCFHAMFAGCTNLTVVSVDLLKFAGEAQELAPSCYQAMFADSGLTTTLNLPSTKLSQSCYQELFKGTQITSLPNLVSTNVPSYAYRGMFKNCPKLINATPDSFKTLLPATTLGLACYESMFENTNIPKVVADDMSTYFILPATQSSIACYKNMFSGSNIRSLPTINLTNVKAESLSGMFANCVYLTSIDANWKVPAPESEQSDYCYFEMFKNCFKLSAVPDNMFKAEANVTMAPDCAFQSTFENCHNLSSVGVIPYTKFGISSCTNMFNGCLSLTDASTIFVSIAEVYYASFQNAFANCTSLVVPAKIDDAIQLDEFCFTSMYQGCRSLPITLLDIGGTAFFTCPEEIINGAVDNMFTNTLYSLEKEWTPQGGYTYYYQSV